jgi:enoyl-CoA hydratase/carnithine racemase
METLELERQGALAWVWLNRPRRLNAMNPLMFEELRGVFQDLDDDESVRAIVLAGRGPVFSAGFDVSWMVDLTAEEVARDIDQVRAVYDAIEACAKPLIVAARGLALGGGLLLALVADLVLASEGTSFGVPEVKLGFFPPLDMAPRLERLVGLGAAKRIVLTGEPFDAAEAQRIGLVGRVVHDEDLYEQAGALAKGLAALPPTGVQLAKSAFVPRGDYRAWETAQVGVCWASPERKAMMDAFLGGRKTE